MAQPARSAPANGGGSAIRALFARVGMFNWGIIQDQPLEIRARMLPDVQNVDQPTRFARSFVSLYPNQSPRDPAISSYLPFRRAPGVNQPLYLPANATPRPPRSAVQLQASYLDAPPTVPGGGVGASINAGAGQGPVNMLGE